MGSASDNELHGMTQHCRDCGRSTSTGTSFASPRSILCVHCKITHATARTEWTRNYHSARARAVSRLVKDFHPHFAEYLDEELGRTG